MAAMAFEVTSDLSGLAKLKKEIESLREEIKRFYEAGGSGSDAKKMEDRLESLKKQHEKLENSLSPVIHKFQQLRDTGKDVFSDIAKSEKMDDLNQKIELQIDILEKLKAQFVSYKAEYDKLIESKNYTEGGNTYTIGFTKEEAAQVEAAGKLYRQVEKDIKSEEEALKKLIDEQEKERQKLKEVGDTKTTYMTQIRQTKQAMMELAQQGKQNTQEYEALKEKLKELGISMRMVNKEQKNLTTSGGQLQGIMTGMRGVAGAFTATQGVVGMFTKDAEKLAAVQTKLQAAMSITIGLQATSEMLHKTSAFRMNTVTKATELWTRAQMLLNTQFGISVGMSKIIMASVIGALIAGVALIVKAYQTWKNEQKEISQEIAKFKAEINKSVQSEITNVRALEAVLKNSNNTYNVRLAALGKIKEVMPEYNAMLDKEGNLIVDNTDALKRYIEKIKSAAEAKIAAEKVVASENAFDDWVAKLTKSDIEALFEGDSGMLSLGHKYAYEVLSKQRDKLKSEIDKWNERLEKAQAGAFKTSDAEEGTKEYWENQRKLALNLLDTMKETEKGTETWRKAVSQYNLATEKLKTWDFSEKKEPKIDINKSLEAAKTAQDKIRQQQLDMEFETQQMIIDSMEEGIEKELAQIALNYERRMAAEAKLANELIAQQQELERKLWEAENPDWKEKKLEFKPKTTSIEQLTVEQQRQIADRHFLAEEAMTQATRDALQKRLADYQLFENKQRDIQKKYTGLRLALDKQYGSDRGAAYQEALENINRAEQEDLDGLIRSKIEASEAFSGLNKIIEQEGRAAIKELIKRLEEYMKVVEKTAGKESEMYKKARKEMKTARRELDADTIESYKKVADIFSLISHNMSGTSSGFSKAAAEIAQAAVQVYQAFQSDNKAGQVSGIISAALGITAAIRDWRYEYIGFIDPIEENAKIYKQISDSIEVSNIRLQRQKQLLEDMVGIDLVKGKFDLMDDLTKKQEEAFNKLTALNIKFIDSQEERYKDANNTFIRIAGGILNPASLFFNGKKNGANELYNAAFAGGQMQTEIIYKFKSIDTSGFKDIEEYRDLLLEIKENGGMLNGKEVLQADIDALNALIDEYDAAVAEIKNIKKELEQIFTNTTADAISQSIADGFMQGKRSMTDFADDFETLMRNAVRASFRINVTDALAKDFYQKFVDATQSDFLLTSDEIISLRNEFMQSMSDASEQWKMFEQILKDAGINISDAASTDNSLRGALAKASQESIDLLAGQMGAVRVKLEEIVNMQKNKSLSNENNFFEDLYNGIAIIQNSQAFIKDDVRLIRELSHKIAENSDAITALTQDISVSNSEISKNTDEIKSLSIDVADSGNTIAELSKKIAESTHSTAKSLTSIDVSGIKIKGI